MTEISSLVIKAFVSDGEKSAVQLAATQLAQALEKAAGVPWTCDCVFSQGMEMLQPGVPAALFLTSLLPELQRLDEPWSQTEQRLRKTYATLCERDVPVFICTILRHVNRGESPERMNALRLRIRQLNLLAAEISHETRAYVLDLDRLLADIGARRLQTDYRLGNPVVDEMAGHFIALTLLTNAFDARIPFEIQDAAGAILAASQPSVARAEGMTRESRGNRPLPQIEQRKTTAPPVVNTIEEIYPGWLVPEVKTGPKEVVRRLIQALRRNGLRGTVAIALQRYDFKKNTSLFVHRISRKITRGK